MTPPHVLIVDDLLGGAEPLGPVSESGVLDAEGLLRLGQCAVFGPSPLFESLLRPGQCAVFGPSPLFESLLREMFGTFVIRRLADVVIREMKTADYLSSMEPSRPRDFDWDAANWAPDRRFSPRLRVTTASRVKAIRRNKRKAQRAARKIRRKTQG